MNLIADLENVADLKKRIADIKNNVSKKVEEGECLPKAQHYIDCLEAIEMLIAGEDETQSLEPIVIHYRKKIGIFQREIREIKINMPMEDLAATFESCSESTSYDARAEDTQEIDRLNDSIEVLRLLLDVIQSTAPIPKEWQLMETQT